MRETPMCKTGPKWIVERFKDRSALAALTGQDWSALQAFFHLVELYARADQEGRNCALSAMYHTVTAMQPHVRLLAKAGIPHVLDWQDEDRIWLKLLQYGEALRDVVRPSHEHHVEENR